MDKGGDDDADGSDADADGSDADAEDTSDSPPKVKGIWWLERGGCYQAKRKITLDGGDPIYQWKRFKSESHSVTDLCAAHEDARQWAAGGI